MPRRRPQIAERHHIAHASFADGPPGCASGVGHRQGCLAAGVGSGIRGSAELVLLSSLMAKASSAVVVCRVYARRVAVIAPRVAF
jgi:hypothetical protein